jgi:AAA domain
MVAPAGCGKTEQIARSTQLSDGRRLILTHTHAGVDALRQRLKKHKVQSDKCRIETIAGWCLRYGISFPKRSGLTCDLPQDESGWNAVYAAAAKLVGSGAVDGVLASSYTGVFIDEYQDCSKLQHEVVKAVAEHLPVCVFGDPLQAIFDFKGQKPVDWDVDVYPSFPKTGEFSTPWRWNNAGNKSMGDWVSNVRCVLEKRGPLDLTTRPACVRWERLPGDPGQRQGTIVGTCKSVLGRVGDGDIIVIGDAANINARATLAQKLASVGFSTIEPLGCVNLYSAAKKIASKVGFARLESVMDFICECMIGAEKTPFLDAVKSQQGGGRAGTAKFGSLVKAGIAVAESTGAFEEVVLALMDGFRSKTETRLYRREMFFAMRAALRIKCARPASDLGDTIWEVQNRIRHAGRNIAKRSIGSTLLVKGLEFAHAIVIHADSMTRKDWYVALTRATTGLTILSPLEQIVPAI